MLLPGLIWPDWLMFFAGAALSGGMAMYMWAIDSPPEWIERKRRGRDGERRTEQRLKKLERRGWTVAHDIQADRAGNFDHVLVGPGGAYLLETKDLSGRAVVDGGRITLHRGEDERDSWYPARPFDATVRAAAYELQQRLLPATGIKWFQGVVVLWSGFPQKEAQLDNVFVVHGDHLVDWLQARPQILGGDALERAQAHLEDLQQYEIAREQLAKAA